jgi:glutaredoxin 3
MNSKMREEMLDRSDGRYTVPQIFIDGLGIGGSDELADLDNSGKLDSILDL